MSRKKTIGIVSLFLILNGAGLVMIGGMVENQNYCANLLKYVGDSALSNREFAESHCLDDLGWFTDEYHPDREALEQLSKERFAEKYPEYTNSSKTGLK